MSIIGAADVFTMNHERGGPDARPEPDALVAMQLLADGVPLELLVDIAMGSGSPVEAENPGYYWL